MTRVLGQRPLVGDDRFGQPRPDVGAAGVLVRAQPVDREAGRDRDEPRARVVERRRVGFVVASEQPEVGLLRDILGFGDGAEHPVGDVADDVPVRGPQLGEFGHDR